MAQQSWPQELQKIPFNPLLLLVFFIPFLYVYKRITNDKPNLPPSPPKLPIIGNLHQLGTLPHRSLQALSNKYGPLMFLYLGNAPTLVVSSADMAREITKTNDITFSNRPKNTAVNILFYGCKGVAFSPYGDYWIQARKICVLELLSLKSVQSFQYVREEEVEVLNNKIRDLCFNEASINLSEMLITTTNNIISRCIVGQKFEDKNGLIPSMKATSRELDIFLDQVIEEHKTKKSDGGHPNSLDFVDILLRLQKNDMPDFKLLKDNLKAILMDMFVGGTDTSSAALEWLMTEFIKNPSIMKRAQEEVRRVVGKKSKIDVNDVNQMDYLKCVIKETLRLHPPLPLLVPRETITSVRLGDYDIPPKTRVYTNTWAIQRDPKVWERPEEFIPERFEGNPIDFKGQDFEFIPFGGGRRGCPGMTFGIASVEYVAANLLCWFDWKLPSGNIQGEELDMTEISALTAFKKIPLHLVPILHSP